MMSADVTADELCALSRRSGASWLTRVRQRRCFVASSGFGRSWWSLWSRSCRCTEPQIFASDPVRGDTWQIGSAWNTKQNVLSWFYCHKIIRSIKFESTSTLHVLVSYRICSVICSTTRCRREATPSMTSLSFSSSLSTSSCSLSDGRRFILQVTQQTQRASLELLLQ